MKEKPGNAARITHILEAIEKIKGFIAGMSFEAFVLDEKTRLACVKAIEIIGEASMHITPELREKAAEIPWPAIIGLRHILVHEYHGINDSVIWRIITHDLAELEKEMLALQLKLKA